MLDNSRQLCDFGSLGMPAEVRAGFSQTLQNFRRDMRDLAKRVARAVEHSAANAAFTVDQAREEVTGIMESAAIQFMGQRNIDAETLWAAAGPALNMNDDVPKLTDGGGE